MKAKTTCRYCHVEIGFKRLANGNCIPVDPERVGAQEAFDEYGEDAVLVIEEPPESGEWFVFKGKNLDGMDAEGYITHFATCPYADEARKGR